MRRKLLLMLLLCVSLLLTGCSISLDSLGLGKLEEKLGGLIGSDPVICTITSVDGSILTVEVLSPDSHYDEGDLLYLDCASVDISSYRQGNTITFDYDYVTGVTIKNDDPFIFITSISPATYVPPATEESTEA